MSYNMQLCDSVLRHTCGDLQSVQSAAMMQMGMKGTSQVDICIMQEDEPAFLPLEQLHHSAEVTGADTCLRRPIIATASLDRSVRLWNYLNRCATQDDLHCLKLL